MGLSADGLPISINALIFPSAAHNFSRTLLSLKQSNLSITNRLSSIEQDSRFIRHVAERYDLPLVANERCGSWYVPPQLKVGSAYFKSTDGHQGQWSFSKRRLNLQVLHVIGKHAGCIIIDSTRRGKSMPDALSKTVPIWCAVINRLLFPEHVASCSLRTPTEIVGRSEHAQIEEKLNTFLEDAKALHLNVSSLRQMLRKPLLPAWITQDSILPVIPVQESEYHLMVCCTASRHIKGAEGSEGGYIQGAGDDSEGWSQGLTPIMFWKNKIRLVKTSEEYLPRLIAELVDDEKASNIVERPVLVLPTEMVYIGTSASARSSKAASYDCVIICEELASEGEEHDADIFARVLRLRCGTGKLGSRALRSQLTRLQAFIASVLTQARDATMLFVCSTGWDLSVGAALAALCLYFGDEGRMSNYNGQSASVDKAMIRRRLSWITTSKPEANPSRSTLQAVNSFLMPR